MTNTQSFAQRELAILSKSSTDPENRPIIEPFTNEILALCEKFGMSGQSGGSAPYTAGAISGAIKKLLLQEPICPITGIAEEWQVNDFREGWGQNNRCYSLFKDTKSGKAHYLDAIVWKGEDEHDTFTGGVQGEYSRQFIKSFPFIPKTFYIDVYRVPYDKEKHSEKDAVSCGDGDYVYFIKSREQLAKVFTYYDRFDESDFPPRFESSSEPEPAIPTTNGNE